MKKLIITMTLTLVTSSVTAKEFNQRTFLETTVGADIPLRPMPSDLNDKATQSELGQLSANVLSKLYTYVQHIEYSDDKAVVNAKYGNMNCVLDYQLLNEQWKLNKLRCE